MAWKRIILEMGHGADLHGADMTKAAMRACEDALRKVSLPIFSAIGVTPDAMRVTVHLGVGKPDEVDHARVAALFPYGEVTVKPEFGGLVAPDPEGEDQITIASAAIAVHVDLEDGAFQLA